MQDKSLDMKNSAFNTLVVRTLSGIVLLGVVLGAVLFSPLTFAALGLVICIIGMREFYAMARRMNSYPQAVYGVCVGAVTVIVNFAAAYGLLDRMAWLAIAIPGLMCMSVFAIELYRRKENPLGNIAATIMGVLYVAVPVVLLLRLGLLGGADFLGAFAPQGVEFAEHALEESFAWPAYKPWLVLCYIFIIWANDIGAYLVGVGFGRHRLFERISPKKSWEGFFGGVAVALIAGYCAGYLPPQLMVTNDRWFWMGLALITALSGVAGDLVESLFKRAAGVKDSGAVMPGHGGVLDRFDALIYSVPFIFTYFLIFAL